MKKNRILAATVLLGFISVIQILLAVRNIQFHSDDQFMVFAVLLTAVPFLELYSILSNEKAMGNVTLFLLVISYAASVLMARSCYHNSFFIAGVFIALALLWVVTLSYLKKAELKDEKHLMESYLLMMSSHIQYGILLIYLFFEGTNVYSMIVAVCTVLLLFGIRMIVKQVYEESNKEKLIRSKFVLAVILEVGILSMLFLLMPYHSFAKMAYLMSESAVVRFYMDRGVFLLVALLLEIPFGPLFKVTRKIHKEYRLFSK
ncbi:hypothetical protein lbkm_1424 [Lachnospiraceae bacterium KM106-2]|nr:hypothetical protein lbkm_1424 [Lachnospiraceae bacterium KM106-2]